MAFDDPMNQGFAPIEARLYPVGFVTKLHGANAEILGYVGPYTVEALYKHKPHAVATSLLGEPPAPGTFKASPKAEKIALARAQGAFDF